MNIIHDLYYYPFNNASEEEYDKSGKPFDHDTAWYIVDFKAQMWFSSSLTLVGANIAAWTKYCGGIVKHDWWGEVGNSSTMINHRLYFSDQQAAKAFKEFFETIPDPMNANTAPFESADDAVNRLKRGGHIPLGGLVKFEPPDDLNDDDSFGVWEWCHQNLQGFCITNYDYMLFEKPEDAILFALKYAGT